MAYIGRGIKDLSDRVVLDDISVTATDTFDLQLNSTDFVPSSAESLTVSLNGIIQKPQDSYTVSSNQIIFDSALTTSDTIDFIIAERGITLQTPSAGSVNTEQLASTAVTPAKMDLSQDYTFTGAVSGHNYPGFEVKSSSEQQVSHNVLTTAAFGTTVFDTDSAFNGANYDFTVPSGKAGKYFFTTTINCDDDGETWERLILYFGVNSGSFTIFDIHQSHTRNAVLTGSKMFDLSDGDTVKVKVLLKTSTAVTPRLLSNSFFSGFRLGD